LIVEEPVASFRIERADDAPARVLALRAAEPFGQKLDQHISERAKARQEQDHETPRPEPPGLRGVDDEGNVNEKQDYAKWHRRPAAGSCVTFKPPA